MSQGRAWSKVPRGWKRGKTWKFQLYFPGLQSVVGGRKEGCRGKAGVIRISHMQEQGLFLREELKGRGNSGLPLLPALFKCITKALKGRQKDGDTL